MRIISSIILIMILNLWLPAQPAPPVDIDRYAAAVMDSFRVPGLSVAIVKDGRVVLTKGYGTRVLNEDQPVDDRTLFGIASNTKAFTATALALLVEEEKIQWDGKVIDYLPGFRLSDPYVTGELTVLDLLVHRSGLGLGAGDLLWWPETTYDRDEIVRRLRHVPLESSFRYDYAYDNVLYTVAGEVIEAVSGMTWEDFVQKRILEPVGMSASDVRHSAGTGGGNISATHAVVDGQLQRVEPFTSDNVNPAGGIHSNARDMARWMIVQLDSGRLPDGERLYSVRSAEKIWRPVTPKPIPKYKKDLAPLQMHFYFYALGFNVQDYRGTKLITHTGGLPGFVSRVAMIPEHKLGVTVLTNQESGQAFNAIVFYVLDYYLDAQPHDWLYAFHAQKVRAEKRHRQALETASTERNESSTPSLPQDAYAGRYRDMWYGDMEITRSGDSLIIDLLSTPALVGVLKHWQYDTFVARWFDRSLRGDAFVTFVLNTDGTIDRVRMKPFSPAVDFSFDYQDLEFRPVSEK